MVKYRVERKLQDRSHLALEFPQSNGRSLRTYIPFLENVSIDESGRARLNTYNLVGRAGDLFSYGGADSRKFSLTFHLYLPHIIRMDLEEGIADNFKRQFQLFFNDAGAKEAFNLKREELTLLDAISQQRLVAGLDADESIEFDILDNSREVSETTTADVVPSKDNPMGRGHAQSNRATYQEVNGISQFRGAGGLAASPQDITDPPVEIYKEFMANADYSENDKAINLMLAWINLIRASVLNNSRNTVYGPPTVRLTHGTMYGNVPCLVEDYSINVVEEAGYDAQTLTPKRVEIKLNLVETRTGDFGDYIAGDVIQGDNLTGWESIISDNQLDPHNGLVGNLQGVQENRVI
jgi:hypothetical protein